MALTFSEVKSLIDGQIGSVKDVTISNDSTSRGGSSSSPSGGGLLIKRTGEVIGSVSGGSLNITLEGGGLDWQGAVSQDGAASYFTTAQRQMLSLLTKYIDSMSSATIDNMTSLKN